MIREILPRLYSISFNPEHPFWNSEEKWSESFFAAALIFHYETELEQTKGDIDLMLKRATAFVTDVLSLKEQLPDKTVLLDFVQFQACANILTFLSSNKLFPYCFDWINNSITNEVSNSQTRNFYPFRILDMIESKEPYIQSQFSDCFVIWTHDLFYYSRSTGGHNELAQIFIEHYLTFFIAQVQLHQSLKGAMAVCQISVWCYGHDKTEQEEICNNTLYNLYNSSDETVKQLIAFQFCVANRNHTTTSKTEWCKIVQANYKTTLRAHEKVQLIVNLYHRDILLVYEHYEEIIKTIQDYISEQGNANHKFYGYHQSRIFSILEKLLISLIKNGQTEKACKVIGTYFGIRPDEIINQPVLFIIPNTADGPLYSFPDKVLFVDRNPLEKLPEIIQVENQFLGTSHTFTNKLDFELQAPKHSGVPNPSLGRKFSTALSQYMGVKRIWEYEKLNICSGYFLLYGSQLGLQTIMSLETGVSLPIIHSFYQPLSSRKIKKAFLWQGFTQMAEKERIGLEEIFENFAVEIVYKDCHNSTKDEFMSHYKNEQYDLFWISGHGEFAHHESHRSYLDLGNDIHVNIEDLKGISFETNERRLLVINACDGATMSLANSPVSIGIGVSTISKRQSLMSHSWPVKDLPSMILGLLLATFLAQGLSYAEAHNKTLSTFYNGKDAVLEAITRYCENPEVIDRITNGDFDYQNYFYWGSLNYII